MGKNVRTALTYKRCWMSLSNTEVKNEWRYTSSPPACLQDVHRSNFTFTLIAP